MKTMDSADKFDIVVKLLKMGFSVEAIKKEFEENFGKSKDNDKLIEEVAISGGYMERKPKRLSKKTKERVEELNTMNDIMLSMNDENAYMSWILSYPDDATEDDEIEIAESDEDFAYICERFDKVFDYYARHGLYISLNSDFDYGKMLNLIVGRGLTNDCIYFK